MPPEIEIRFGKTRQSGPEHYFRVQISRDGGQREPAAGARPS